VCVCGFVRIFLDEKRFSCNICPARFKDCSSRRRHMRQHTAGNAAHICAFCSMPFKRVAQLKNHLQQQHGTTNSHFTDPSNRDSVATGTLACPELTSCSSADVLYYNTSSSSTAVFNIGQQLLVCDAVGEEAVSQCGNMPAGFIAGSETATADADADSETVMVSAVSEVCDNSGIVGLADKSLDYLHNSCSVSESDLLFPQERSDSLPLPLPSLAEDSISDVIATSNSDSFSGSSLSSLDRPDMSDASAYVRWHVQFAEAACAASVPLAGDRLQAVVSVWSSLVTDMTTLMTDASMAQQQQRQQHQYPALLDVVRKLGAVVELHLQILQPAAACLHRDS